MYDIRQLNYLEQHLFKIKLIFKQQFFYRYQLYFPCKIFLIRYLLRGRLLKVYNECCTDRNKKTYKISI